MRVLIPDYFAYELCAALAKPPSVSSMSSTANMMRRQPKAFTGAFPLIRDDGQPEEVGKDSRQPAHVRPDSETPRLETAKGCHKVIDIAGRRRLTRLEVALDA